MADEDGVHQDEENEEAEPVDQVPVAGTSSLHCRRYSLGCDDFMATFFDDVQHPTFELALLSCLTGLITLQKSIFSHISFARTHFRTHALSPALALLSCGLDENLESRVEATVASRRRRRKRSFFARNEKKTVWSLFSLVAPLA